MDAQSPGRALALPSLIQTHLPPVDSEAVGNLDKMHLQPEPLVPPRTCLSQTIPCQ